MYALEPLSSMIKEIWIALISSNNDLQDFMISYEDYVSSTSTIQCDSVTLANIGFWDK